MIKSWSVWLAVLALGATLACAPAIVEVSPSEGTGVQKTLKDGQTALTPPAERPKNGGLLTIPPSEGPKTLNPYLGTGAPLSHAFRPVLQTLVELYQPAPDRDVKLSNQVEPMLAERWEMPDDKSIIFHLRKGVRFHSGEEFTADDVLFTMEYARDPKNAFSARTQYRTIDKIEKVDAYTVRVTLKDLDPEIMRRITGANAFILSKKFFDGGGDPTREVVGTGPFKVAVFEPAKEYIAVRNPDYWDKGKPYLDGIRLIFGLERSAILAAFATRKVDHYNVTDKVQFDEFQRQVPDLKYYVFNSDYNYGWYPNMSRPPLSDIRVRRAMQLVIDRQALNDAVAFGLGLISAPGDAGFLGDAGLSQEELFKLPGYRQPKDQDIAEAKRLMNEAGYANGFKVKGVYVSTFTTVPQIAELMANQLKNTLNVEIELVGFDLALWSDAVDKRGDYDLAMGQTRITSNPDTNLTNYWYSKGSFNKAGINDPKLDDLILRQKTMMDENERRRAWAEISKVITEQVYYMPGVDGAYFGIVQPWVNNLYGNFAAQPWLRKAGEMWIDVDKMPAERRQIDAEALSRAKGR